MEELFDGAADVEVKPDGKKPQQQQPHQLQMHSAESSQQGGKKRIFRETISKPAEALKHEISKSGKDDTCPPAGRVSPELYETGKSEAKCIHRRVRKHKSFRCTKYMCANYPGNLAPPGDRKEFKCQYFFDSH
jgi:hypothetical protein